MSFTGKATYSAGATLPELADDVADLVGLVAQASTPLLDALGDPLREAASTRHEWLEDTLLPNRDAINDAAFGDPDVDTDFVVDHASYFRVGDQIQVQSSEELMLVTAVTVGTNTLTVVRGYGGTTAENLADNQVINILGNAALEGADAPATRLTSRARVANYAQIFTAAVEVSGSDQAAAQVGGVEDLEWQKVCRLRELLRELEQSVLCGTVPAANPEGSATVRRTMKGMIPFLTTNVFRPGVGTFPAGALTEAGLNQVLRAIWEDHGGQCDLIAVGGKQKRVINTFVSSLRRYDPEDLRFSDRIAVYESDFGVCRIACSPWVPPDACLLLDTRRIAVMPLRGRSFHYKPLAASGDAEKGELIGEYTLEFRDQAAHGMIRDLP